MSPSEYANQLFTTLTSVAAVSPTSHTSSLSPKTHSPDPNINPFSPLSPDPTPSQPVILNDSGSTNVDGEQASRPFIFYSRRELLFIGKECRKRGPPEGMGPLESWFGTISRPNQNNSNFEDPAIASIHPSGRRNNNTNGGYGEGFGYGGGIGGSNRLGGNTRGTRNIGLRRLPEGIDPPLHVAPTNPGEKVYTGQMGKFNVKNANTMRLGGDEPRKRNNKNNNEDWRSKQRENGHSFRGDRDRERSYQTRDRRSGNWNQNHRDEDEQPEWMNDSAPADPAIVGADDPLVKFIPGEDMIVAHKRAMKARNADDWRGGLPAFFGGDPAIASSSAPTAPIESKPKEMNANNYLVESKDDAEDSEHQAPSQSAFSSRFHKFFNNTSSTHSTRELPNEASGARTTANVSDQTQSRSSSVQMPQSDNPMDQRKATLMGLLSTKALTPKLDTPLIHNESPHGQPYCSSGSLVDVSSSIPSSNTYGSSHRPPTNVLLQQLYGNPTSPSVPRDHSPTDPLQLLAQAQTQRQTQQFSSQHSTQTHQQPHMSQHMSLPPFSRPPPSMYPSGDSMGSLPDFPPFMRPPNFPQGPPPPSAGYLPMPPNGPFFQGPPRPPHAMPVGFSQPPQPPMQGQDIPQGRYPPGQMNLSQQDMLSTLFAGLNHRND
nr:hypothetical protein L204_03779 [Cryptococcus depauperatus CBS 7855]